ncbi:YybS family protein [Bacillus sp. FJAT-29814]|uniref:YybS family protein n=1 Tax=Bacillus sp. FJAT-29814 TaxID=1729688 RepID=UPI000B008300|nr:YybS family protein [Bacillus sp. FJAT-29814]
MKNVRKLTEGAMLLAVFTIIMLITFYIPLLGFLNLFLPLPFILFAAKYEWKWTLVFLAAAIGLSLITGSILSVPTAIGFGTTGVVMGILIRKQKDRFNVLLAGSFVFLINLIIMYGVSIIFFKIDFITEMVNMMKQSLNMSADMLKSFGQEKEAERTIEQFKKGLDLFRTLLPTLLVASSFIIVFMIQLVNYPIIKRFGIEMKKWKPFKDIRLPKSLLWILMFTLLASMLLNPQEGTYWYAALLNLTYVLQMLMVFQGYTYLFYYFDVKGMSKALSITLAVVSFIIPILLYIVGILGIIDLGFDLRRYLIKKQS